jgi:DNA topoisomerase-2
VEKEPSLVWVLNADDTRMVQKEISFVPGLYKIFDEILVNAADNKQRDNTMNKLKVDVDVETGAITVFNNGAGIPVTMHGEHNCYVPELIFGNLLTSSNYDDSQKKTTGGRNGYGAKLANIFSTSFTLETVDSSRGYKYVQTWTNNMQTKGKPKVTKCSKKDDYTKVTFTPDYAKFGMAGLDEDIVRWV